MIEHCNHPINVWNNPTGLICCSVMPESREMAIKPCVFASICNLMMRTIFLWSMKILDNLVRKKNSGCSRGIFQPKNLGILILSVVYQNVKIFEKWPFILEKTSTRYHRTFGVSLWACLKNAYQEAAFSIFTSQKAWKTIDGWQLPIFGMHCT